MEKIRHGEKRGTEGKKHRGAQQGHKRDKEKEVKEERGSTEKRGRIQSGTGEIRGGGNKEKKKRA